MVDGINTLLLATILVNVHTNHVFVREDMEVFRWVGCVFEEMVLDCQLNLNGIRGKHIEYAVAEQMICQLEV
jgi:hypothetical protein